MYLHVLGEGDHPAVVKIGKKSFPPAKQSCYMCDSRGEDRGNFSRLYIRAEIHHDQFFTAEKDCWCIFCTAPKIVSDQGKRHIKPYLCRKTRIKKGN